MRTRTRRTAALAAAGLMLLTGCRSDEPAREPAGGDLRQPASDGQPAGATPITVDACELLTAAEVEDAFGRPVAVEPVTETDCNYVIEGDDGLDTDLTMSLVSPVEVTADTFPSVIAAGVGNDVDTQQLDGPGDVAMLSTRGEITIVNVLQGQAWLTLSVLAPDGSDRSAEALTQLAELAVGRLADVGRTRLRERATAPIDGDVVVVPQLRAHRDRMARDRIPARRLARQRVGRVVGCDWRPPKDASAGRCRATSDPRPPGRSRTASRPRPPDPARHAGAAGAPQ